MSSPPPSEPVAEPERAVEPPPEASDVSTVAEAPGAPRRNPLDAAGMERPAFLLDFPDDPGIERLIAAFEAGNYALVRREAAGIAEQATDPAVKAAALELRERIEPDPLARYLLFVSALLVLLLTIWAYRTAGH